MRTKRFDRRGVRAEGRVVQTLQSEHGKEGRVRELVARVRQLIERSLLARDLVRDALEARAHEAERQKIDPGLVEQERWNPESSVDWWRLRTLLGESWFSYSLMGCVFVMSGRQAAWRKFSCSLASPPAFYRSWFFWISPDKECR